MKYFKAFNFKMNVGISKNSDIYNKIKKNGLKKIKIYVIVSIFQRVN